MYARKLLIIITIIELTTIIVGQVWPPYEMYDPFYNSYPYQGFFFFNLFVPNQIICLVFFFF